MRPLELAGKRFGRLTAIRRVGKDSCQYWQWLCVCDHADSSRKPVRVVVSVRDLADGRKKSCGCLRRETSIAQGKSFLRHGMSKHPLYQVWRNMKARCYSPQRKDYHRYGGRGIRMCRSWLTSDNFFAWAKNHGYKPGLTVERRDNNKNYCPGNCYFDTWLRQARNKRNTVRVTVNGKLIPLIDACDTHGISCHVVRDRLKRGWELMEALTSPVNRHNKRHRTVNGRLVGR